MSEEPTSFETVAARIEADKSLDSLKDMRAVLLAVPEMRRLVVAAAVRALGARKGYYSKAEEGMVYEPDCNSQMKAAAFLTAYADGLPLQGTINLNADLTERKNGKMTVEDALRRSPALLEAMKKEIKRVESRGSSDPGETLVAAAVVDLE